MVQSMMNCKEATYLISRQLDDKLPLSVKAALASHLMMCPRCRRFKKQTKIIYSLLLQFQKKTFQGVPIVTLTPDQKDRMVKNLRNNIDPGKTF